MMTSIPDDAADVGALRPNTKGALTGIKVLDLTRLLPGAFCTQILSDFGADVVKIEEPTRGDYGRKVGTLAKQEAGSFLLLNRNKRSLTLNLKSDEGQAIFLRLVADADIVLEGFRPGVAKRLGIDYAALKKINPRVIYCAISGFGQDGPYAKRSGHDLNYLSIAGALQLFATPATGPIVPGLSVADVGGGSLMATIGILVAMAARQHTGVGQFIDISMTDGVIAWLALHGADYLFAGHEPRGGEEPFIGQAPCYNVYRCADGKYVALGIVEHHFWIRFCEAIGKPSFIARQWPEGAEALAQHQHLQALFVTKPRDQWIEQLVPLDIPITPVNSMAEAFSDQQVRHRNMLMSVNHPVEGEIPQLGFPIKLSDTPGKVTLPPPTLGQHSESMLREIGYSLNEISDLKLRGII
jgi:crotonobetainyl-CoA:carnitine CoA-transferase CaiB-like acyl-CoA transferase